jgi:hypothetical protein
VLDFDMPKKKTGASKRRKPSIRKKSRASSARGKARKRVPPPIAEETGSVEGSTLQGHVYETIDEHRPRRGTGAASAGQSGDVQGLSRSRDLDSESVEELLEEGQYHEAEILSGVENALDPDEGEVETREVLGNDIPAEYLDQE